MPKIDFERIEDIEEFSPVSPGTYFCRLQTEEGVRQHKILLLR